MTEKSRNKNTTKPKDVTLLLLLCSWLVCPAAPPVAGFSLWDSEREQR